MLILLVLAPVLLALGLWQLDRAGQRRALYENKVRVQAIAPVAIRGWEQQAAPEWEWRRVLLRGRFLPGVQILLDNQLYRGQAGYHVFTPLQEAAPQEARGRVLLVNRGWVPVGLDRRLAPRLSPVPRGFVQLSGTLKPFPFSGIRLRELPPEQLAPGVYRVHSLQQEALQEQLGRELFGHVLRLGPESPEGYLRVWAPPRSGAGRNIAYALQYFAMALVALVVFIMLGVVRVAPERGAGEGRGADEERK